jgi:uncharacterized membrane protein YjjB (DUF3815 family)
VIIGSDLFGTELGGLIGAMAAGLYANMYARIKMTPSHIALLPGILVLVPGSKVFIGLNSVLTGQEIVANSGNSSQALMIFMGIVAGLIFANVILPPRQRVLRSG